MTWSTLPPYRSSEVPFVGIILTVRTLLASTKESPVENGIVAGHQAIIAELTHGINCQTLYKMFFLKQLIS